MSKYTDYTWQYIVQTKEAIRAERRHLKTLTDEQQELINSILNKADSIQEDLLNLDHINKDCGIGPK